VWRKHRSGVGRPLTHVCVTPAAHNVVHDDVVQAIEAARHAVEVAQEVRHENVEPVNPCNAAITSVLELLLCAGRQGWELSGA
jgi:hypothetical protein